LSLRLKRAAAPIKGATSESSHTRGGGGEEKAKNGKKETAGLTEEASAPLKKVNRTVKEKDVAASEERTQNWTTCGGVGSRKIVTRNWIIATL